jgi:NADPH2:quinone reductase
MHAIRQYEFGPPETLRYEEVPDPVPGPAQVRIAVEAAGVHLVDTTIRRGIAGGPFPLPSMPMTPGREVAGVVEAVGSNVDADWLGRRVVAHLGQASGGYAELALADVASLHELAPDEDATAAVAMIGTGRTAIAILDAAMLTRDDVALVTAAAGGIGALLVQAARNVGAVVVGAAGGRKKAALAETQGANFAVDYSADDWTDAVRAGLEGRNVSVAFDGVGGALGRAAFDLLGPAGRFVLYGLSSGEPTPMSAMDLFGRGLTATGAIGARILQAPGGLRSLEDRSMAALVSGELRPLVGEPFPLQNAAAAHHALERRETVGKTVLVP